MSRKPNRGHLSVEEQAAIKADYATGLYSHEKVAKRYNTNPATVRAVINDTYRKPKAKAPQNKVNEDGEKMWCLDDYLKIIGNTI